MTAKCMVARSCQATPVCGEHCLYSQIEGTPTVQQKDDLIRYWQDHRAGMEELIEIADPEQHPVWLAELAEIDEEIARLSRVPTR